MTIGSGPNSTPPLSGGDGIPGTKLKKTREKQNMLRYRGIVFKKQRWRSRYSLAVVTGNVAWMEKLDEIAELPR